ncbi:sulfur oxidation c-type cytochrome SoxX [Lutimaribacter marinistellae]|uniref:Sulfur oxidation c-type cytochrome SoxX n=1 Tax=Lutimaribacter marinistellae TaxID=1820329 RepID=A0ABV7TEH6_9RHOB
MKLKSLTLAAVMIGGVAYAAEVAPTEVAFDEYGAVEASLTGKPGDPAAGAMVVGSKSAGNCVACHAVSALSDIPFHGEVGPTLDGAGDRWSEAELRGLMVNAKKTFDGTVMPAFYKTDGFTRPGDGYTGKAAGADLPPLLSAEQIEDVVAFLVTLKEE